MEWLIRLHMCVCVCACRPILWPCFPASKCFMLKIYICEWNLTSFLHGHVWKAECVKSNCTLIIRLSNSKPLLITHEQRLGNISLGAYYVRDQSLRYPTCAPRGNSRCNCTLIIGLSNSKPLLITHEQRLGNISLRTWHNILETNPYVTLVVLQGEIPVRYKRH